MTNNYDTELQAFFYDIQGVLYLKDFSNQWAENIINNAIKILDKKLYSDINIQDKYGNTYLHYAMIEHNDFFIDKLLKNGANPYIKNHKNENSFASHKVTQTDIREFWTKYTRLFNIDNSLKSKTENFNYDFKQTIFQSLSSSCLFDLPSKINILKDNDLLNVDNLLCYSKTLDYFNPIINEEFLKLNPSPSNISNYLKNNLINNSNLDFDYPSEQFKESILNILNSNFLIDDNIVELISTGKPFDITPKNIVNANKFKMEVCNIILKKVFNDININPLTKELQDKLDIALVSKPTLNNIYLKITLNNLYSEKTNKTRLKI